MALTDKDILITPNRGQASDPIITFSGADASTTAQNINVKIYPTNGGTLSFEGSLGQLFSIANTMSGTIFSANDISGIPSIEVLDTGLVKLAQYSGNVLIGSGTDDGINKLQVNGDAIFGIKSTSTSSTSPISISLGSTYSSVAGANAKLILSESTSDTNIYGLGISSSQLDYIAGTANSGSHAWYSGSNQRMKIDASGTLSVGLSNNFTVSSAGAISAVTGAFNKGAGDTEANIRSLVASNILNLASNYGTGVTFAQGIAFSSSDSNPSIPKAGIYSRFTTNGSLLYFGTSSNYSVGVNNNAMIIDYVGNVGLGISPTFKLDIKLTSDTAGIRLNGFTPSTSYFNNYINNIGTSLLESVNGHLLLNNNTATNGVFIRSGTTSINLNDTNANNILMAVGGGKVGIGTSSPRTTFEVVGDAFFSHEVTATNFYGNFIGNLIGGDTSTAIKTVTSNYNVQDLDQTIGVSGNVAVYLPLASLNTGKIITVKKLDGIGTLTTVDASGADLIDGAPFKILSKQNDKVTIQSNGTAWWITESTNLINISYFQDFYTNRKYKFNALNNELYLHELNYDDTSEPANPLGIKINSETSSATYYLRVVNKNLELEEISYTSGIPNPTVTDAENGCLYSIHVSGSTIYYKQESYMPVETVFLDTATALKYLLLVEDAALKIVETDSSCLVNPTTSASYKTVKDLYNGKKYTLAISAAKLITIETTGTGDYKPSYKLRDYNNNLDYNLVIENGIVNIVETYNLSLDEMYIRLDAVDYRFDTIANQQAFQDAEIADVYAITSSHTNSISTLNSNVASNTNSIVANTSSILANTSAIDLINRSVSAMDDANYSNQSASAYRADVAGRSSYASQATSATYAVSAAYAGSASRSVYSSQATSALTAFNHIGGSVIATTGMFSNTVTASSNAIVNGILYTGASTTNGFSINANAPAGWCVLGALGTLNNVYFDFDTLWFRNKTGVTNKMFLSSAGNLIINSATDTPRAEKLQVYGNVGVYGVGYQLNLSSDLPAELENNTILNKISFFKHYGITETIRLYNITTLPVSSGGSIGYECSDFRISMTNAGSTLVDRFILKGYTGNVLIGDNSTDRDGTSKLQVTGTTFLTTGVTTAIEQEVLRLGNFASPNTQIPQYAFLTNDADSSLKSLSNRYGGVWYFNRQSDVGEKRVATIVGNYADAGIFELHDNVGASPLHLDAGGPSWFTGGNVLVGTAIDDRMSRELQVVSGLSVSSPSFRDKDNYIGVCIDSDYYTEPSLLFINWLGGGTIHSISGISSDYTGNINFLGNTYAASGSNVKASKTMVLTAPGNLIIGTTTDSSDKLQVAGSARIRQNVSAYPGTGVYGQLEITGATVPAIRLSIGVNTTSGAYGVGFIQALTNASQFDNLTLQPNGGNVFIGTPATNNATDRLQVLGNVAVTGTTNVYGNLNILASSNLSVGTGFYVPGGVPNSISTDNNTNAPAGLWINYVGYLGGTTQFRDLYVGNGKGASIARFVGASSNLLVGTITDDLNVKLQVNGYATFNSAIENRGTNFTVPTSASSIICTAALSAALPAAILYKGRTFIFKNTSANFVWSNAFNIVPLAGGAATNTILAATAGKFAQLQSDGTNWQIMMAN